MNLTDEFWSNKYKNKQTGWDLASVSTPIKEYVDQLETKNIRILIPGCGNAYEAEYLLQSGFTNITLVDISKALVDQLKLKFKDNSNLQVIHADFFKLKGQYDLIIEQTFFCAILPQLRPDYVIQTHKLLAENGKIVGLLFNKEFTGGPPFGGTADQYQLLFSKHFKIKKMTLAYNSVKPREGTEVFINFVKKKI